MAISKIGTQVGQIFMGLQPSLYKVAKFVYATIMIDLLCSVSGPLDTCTYEVHKNPFPCLILALLHSEWPKLCSQACPNATSFMAPTSLTYYNSDSDQVNSLFTDCLLGHCH